MCALISLGGHHRPPGGDLMGREVDRSRPSSSVCGFVLLFIACWSVLFIACWCVCLSVSWFVGRVCPFGGFHRVCVRECVIGSFRVRKLSISFFLLPVVFFYLPAPTAQGGTPCSLFFISQSKFFFCGLCGLVMF